MRYYFRWSNPDTQELIGKYYLSYKNQEYIPTLLR